jgi:crossover junction endodeoxyribonuclease RusA
MIRLPWPPSELSPNKRHDRRAIAGIRSSYRQQCGWIVRGSGIGKLPPAPVHIDMTFHPPDYRRRDLDNMLATFKAGLDGIGDAIRVDDSWFSLTLRRGDKVDGGAVVVRIEPDQVDAVAVPFMGTIR